MKYVIGIYGLLLVKVWDVKGKWVVNGWDVMVDGMGC